MATQNMGEGISGGNKAAKSLDDTTAAAKGLHGVLKDIEKTVSKLIADFGKLSIGGSSASGGASLPDGMGGGQSSGIMSSDFTGQIDSMLKTLDKKFTPPPSFGERVGTGLGYATKVAFGAMAVMPNTEDAVTQRITSQSVASMSGMSALNLISTSNALMQGGMTSPYSAQTSMAALASNGILPTMGSYQNIMGQVGGFSILTGMSNEQTASGFAGINGMNTLRLGIKVRNPDGSIKDPNEIGNLLYRRMYGNRKITAEQAAQVYNPHSRAYQDVMAAAGGDPALFQSLAAASVFQARNGGQKLDMSAQNVKDKILNLPKDDPMRAYYNYQGSEANKLGAVGENLVKGYSDSLNITASANNLFASIARFAGPIADGLARLAGVLTTLPQTGNMGAGLTGMALGAGDNLLETARSRLEDKGINAVLKQLGLGDPLEEAFAGLKDQLGGESIVGGSSKGGRGRGGVAGFFGNLKAPGNKIAKLFSGRTISSLLSKRGMTGLLARAGGASGAMSLAGGFAASAFGAAALAGLEKMILDPVIGGLQGYGNKHFSSGVNKAGTIAARTGEYAAMGATLGSILPGPGTAIGAVLGTGYGLFRGIQEANTGGDTQDYQTGGDGNANPHTKPKYYRPTGGKITAWYGQKPKNNSYWRWKGYHTGDDFGVPEGTKVVALTDGKVKHIGSGGDYGNSILIGHDGYDSFYAHLSQVNVKTGNKIKGGQQIGLSGQTGSGAKGPHLHFEIRQGIDNPVNPSKWLKGLVGSSPIIEGKHVGRSVVDTVKDTVGGVGHDIASGIKGAISDVTGTIQRFYDFITGGKDDSSRFNAPNGFGSLNGPILSSDHTGFHSTSSGGTSDLVNIPVPSTDGYGGDGGGSGISSLLGGAQGSSTGGHDHNITINMNVTVASGGTQDAVRLARDVKNILERELRVSKLGDF